MLKWNGGGNPTSLNMKKYLITQDTICNGQRVSAGDVVDITEDEGFNLIACNKAEVYVEKPKLTDNQVSTIETLNLFCLGLNSVQDGK